MRTFIDHIVVGDETRELYIESDNMQFILREYYTIKDGKNEGKEASNLIGYYPSIVSALRRVLTIKVKESTAANLGELIQDMKRIEQRFEELFQVKFAGTSEAV